MLSVPLKSPVWAAISYDLGVTFSIGRDTMNKERYVTVLNQKLSYFIGNDNQHWYRHDGAPPHFSILARQWLDQHFPQQWIGRRGPKEWPPRSPDLTILDFWLWSYIKDQVYAIHNNYTTLNELEEAISHELTNINQEVVRKCYSSFRKPCNLIWSKMVNILNSCYEIACYLLLFCFVVH